MSIPPEQNTSARTSQHTSRVASSLKEPTRAWFTWETQRRNEALSAAFACDFYHLDYSSEGRFLRYLRSMSQTVTALLKRRYDVVFAQCPSIVLCLTVLLCRAFRRFRFVIDAHNIALEKTHSSNSLESALYRSVLKRADYVIVSNDELAGDVRSLGGTPIILPDRVPQISPAAARDFRAAILRETGKHYVFTFVSTFAADEPLEPFLRAWKEAALPAVLYITGRRKKAGALLEFESDTIRFTDFLSRDDYDDLLAQSDVVVDLTTRQGCLVCGAYEALAVKRPVLLSDTAANRTTFTMGAQYTENTAESFASHLRALPNQITQLQAEASGAHQEFETRWMQWFENARALVLRGV